MDLFEVVLSEQGGDLYFEAQEWVSAGRSREAEMLSGMSGCEIPVRCGFGQLLEVGTSNMSVSWFWSCSGARLRHTIVPGLTPGRY